MKLQMASYSYATSFILALLLILPRTTHAQDYCSSFSSIKGSSSTIDRKRDVTTLPTPTTTSNYCDFVPAASSSTSSSLDASATPPIPCAGAYGVQEGYCCSGSAISCTSDNDNSTCSCGDGTLLWNLPLATCVTNNPQYSGCPGNILGGLCCSGPGVSLQSSGNEPQHPVCADPGTAVWTVTTAKDGSIGTSTLKPGGTDGNGGTGTVVASQSGASKTKSGKATESGTATATSAGGARASSTSSGAAMAVKTIASELRLVEKVVAVGVVLLAGL